VTQSGGETVSLTHVPDRLSAISVAINEALEASDVTVVTGGMSVGHHDHVRAALRDAGVNMAFEGVAMRPGKPAAFGTKGRKLAFGLPGNPVSSLVTFVLLVRPALLALAGDSPQHDRILATIDHDVSRTPHTVRVIRCELALGEDGWHARGVGPQSPHTLTSMLGADAFALVPAGGGVLPAGDRVTVELVRP
jgi:molybdopterin molybdotransferase